MQMPGFTSPWNLPPSVLAASSPSLHRGMQTNVDLKKMSVMAAAQIKQC